MASEIATGDGRSNPPEILVAGKKMSIDQATSAMQSNARWFWWIAGLSIANSVAILAGLHYSMVVGLGITQIADGFTLGLLKETSGAVTTVIKGLHVATVGAAAGFFYFLGVKARRARLWAFRLGLAVYFLDALLFVLVKDWVALAFHVFVLFMLWGGYRLAKALVAAESRARSEGLTAQ